MKWEVEATDEFRTWWKSLNDKEKEAVSYNIDLLERDGVNVPYPLSTDVRGSRHRNMRELRSQSGGEPLRTFYAFDPRRTAILLIGGNKTGDDRFYDRMVPIADKIYDQYLKELREEGLL